MNHKLLGFLLAVVTVTFSLPVHAIVGYIDQFVIDKNGLNFFADTFLNNQTPSQETGYGVTGAFPNGAESGGLLTLNSDWGTLTTDAAGHARQALVITRQTANNSFGLTVDDAIDVAGTFSLVTPLAR